MNKMYLTIVLTLIPIGCICQRAEQDQKTIAKEYFLGIYGCDSTVVDRFCTEDIMVSYPLFQQLFNASTIRGQDAVRHFAHSFCTKWTDAKITFHEVIAELNNVVLVWSFTARNVDSTQAEIQPTGQEQSWGGITLIQFNNDGKIEAEIGEESDPGPFKRTTLTL